MAWRRIKSAIKVALSALPTLRVRPIGAPPVAVPIERLKDVFAKPENKYEFYYMLVFSDPELFGAIDAKASLVAKVLEGFSVKAGKELDEEEQLILNELQSFEKLLKSYSYDIAFKLMVYGNACYAIDFASGVGIRKLVYLPMWYLTCVESEQQIAQLEAKSTKVSLEELKPVTYGTQIFKRGLYILNELDDERRQIFTDVVHFDWGRVEEVRDLLGRYTLGVWNQSPLEPLSIKIQWKQAILINDMLWREVNVPRLHYKLSSAPFNPDLFAGATYEQRLKAAQDAADKAIKDFKKSFLEQQERLYPRPDKGIITLDTVEADYIEPKIKYTDPNELLEQIDKSIYSVTVPEAAVSGRGVRAYAAELAVGVYAGIKAERLADQIAAKFIELAKLHLSAKFNNKYTHHYKKIGFKLRKLLERHRLVRDAALLKEIGCFTRTEIRELLDYDPLTEEQKKELGFVEVPHRRTETIPEAAATAKRQVKPRFPLTPQSKEQQQVT